MLATYCDYCNPLVTIIHTTGLILSIAAATAIILLLACLLDTAEEGKYRTGKGMRYSK